MTSLEILEKAKSLIELGYSEGAQARDASGNSVKPYLSDWVKLKNRVNPDARSYNTLGALSMVIAVNPPSGEFRSDDMRLLYRYFGGRGSDILHPRSNASKETVLDAFNTAITIEKEINAQRASS